MKTQKSVLLVLAMLLALVLPSTAHAAKASGWWQSNSGARINIWADSQKLVLTYYGTNGRQAKYNGWWTQVGRSFQYQAPGMGVISCTIDARNPNVIYAQSPGGQNTWQRINANQPPQNNSYQYQQPYHGGNANGNIAGWWQSTSGAKIQIWADQQRLVLTYHGTNGQTQKFAGWWTTPGRAFQYKVPGLGVASCALDNRNPNLLHVQSPNSRNTWQRMSTGQPQHHQQPQPGNGTLGGVWRSTTGATITIWSDSQKVVITIRGTNGKQARYGGWWTTPGRAFQYRVNNREVVSCALDGRNPNIIHVQSYDGRNTWQRMGGNGTGTY